MTTITKGDCVKLFDMKTINGDAKTLWIAPGVELDDIQGDYDGDTDLTYYDDVTDFIGCITNGDIEINDDVEYVIAYDKTTGDIFIVEVPKEDF